MTSLRCRHGAVVGHVWAGETTTAAGPCAVCGRALTRLYPGGTLCPWHAPGANPTPDPAATVAGLRARAERLRAEADARRLAERRALR